MQYYDICCQAAKKKKKGFGFGMKMPKFHGPKFGGDVEVSVR